MAPKRSTLLLLLTAVAATSERRKARDLSTADDVSVLANAFTLCAAASRKIVGIPALKDICRGISHDMHSDQYISCAPNGSEGFTLSEVLLLDNADEIESAFASIQKRCLTAAGQGHMYDQLELMRFKEITDTFESEDGRDLFEWNCDGASYAFCSLSLICNGTSDNANYCQNDDPKQLENDGGSYDEWSKGKKEINDCCVTHDKCLQSSGGNYTICQQTNCKGETCDANFVNCLHDVDCFDEDVSERMPSDI